MKDLLVITPSRGRPQRLREMLDACLALSAADTDIVVGCDDDLDGYRELAGRYSDGRVRWFGGPRTGFAGWTNRLASRYTQADPDGDGHLPRYRAFASLGDDHIPRTQGWDKLLLEAIDQMGGSGIAYGNDLFTGPDWTDTDKAAYLEWWQRRMGRDIRRVRLRRAMRELQEAGRR
jgi:hypothetical protein